MDRRDQAIFDAKYPALVYQNFAAVPDVVVKTLLFIENHKLLEAGQPYRNPAVEWTRLTRAIMDKGIKFFVSDHGVPGGSTLATQIEKFGHTSGGITAKPYDKLVQMVSASFRAYKKGENTLSARQQIVVDYINSVPLGAVPVFGEVLGLGSALEAWYGVEFEDINALLRETQALDQDDEGLMDRAKAYKQVLSLFIAQRRPALYLQQRPDALQVLTQKHISILARQGVISEKFAQAVSEAKINLAGQVSWRRPEQLFFIDRKAANAIRMQLLKELGLHSLYELDRFDLKVNSTIDYQAQREVTDILQKVRDPQGAKLLGLQEYRLLERGDPSQVHYSFTLMERVGETYALRVQTDSLGKPFNLNDSGKLELGSTAKLRVLVNYLQVMEEAFYRYEHLSAEDLHELSQEKIDKLSHWVIEYLRDGGVRSASAILDAAMERVYSASPYERFFTGGGIHLFSNFQKEDDHRSMSVLHAFRRSVNLPFVRIMRDIVSYYLFQMPEYPQIIHDENHPMRRDLLESFADKEGRQFITKYYRKYKDKAEPSQLLAKSLRRHGQAFAAAFRTIHPEGSLEEMQQYVASNLPSVYLTNLQLQQLYRKFAPDNLNLTLHDRGYIAKVHPLELWVVSYLQQHPKANLLQLFENSHGERLAVYQWLLTSRNKSRQDKRLQVILEANAFRDIHMAWMRVGYPFTSLIPTYASSLGSSGDRPSALAELVGIIMSDGYRYNSVRISEIQFAAATPYETTFQKNPSRGVRVLSEDVARQAKRALVDVVEEGTGQRVNNILTVPGCQKITLGGKTGTGDNRYRLSEPGSQVLESRTMNRTATFVFFVGDRYFGTITAYVPTVEAANYGFTSALPVQILKTIIPRIMPEPLSLDCQASMADRQI